MVYNIKKYVLIFLGSILVIIGIIGIFLPLIPTTPFLLIASYCYVRSSQKLYNKLMNNKYLGKYINDYIKKKEIPLKIKFFTITILWLTILISFIVIGNKHIKYILIFIALSVTIHILKLRSSR